MLAHDDSGGITVYRHSPRFEGDNRFAAALCRIFTGLALEAIAIASAPSSPGRAIDFSEAIVCV